MRVNKQQLLERCISDGIESGLLSTKVEELTLSQQHQLMNDLAHYIWLEIDSYFTFDEDN